MTLSLRSEPGGRHPAVHATSGVLARLPECVAAARREKRHRTVRLEIVDPTDEAVCESYAHYRRSLSDRPDGTGEVRTTDRTGRCS
ncbi:hypothetical protein AB0C14_03905 [Microbispora hainanensis]|uniref:hypothetical protein n=1 Tax=Microbispora hainanensis TaxID=568844 RepID=UPI0033E4038A